jgi:hypothetical protein
MGNFQGQSQTDGQVHRVDHADHEIRRRLAGDPPEQHVARDRLVERGGIQ